MSIEQEDFFARIFEMYFYFIISRHSTLHSETPSPLIYTTCVSDDAQDIIQLLARESSYRTVDDPLFVLRSVSQSGRSVHR